MKSSKNAPAKENKTEEKEELKPIPPIDNIVQPNPNAEDKQEYIKENAKKGESVYVPNVIGPNPVSHKLADEK